MTKDLAIIVEKLDIFHQTVLQNKDKGVNQNPINTIIIKVDQKRNVSFVELKVVIQKDHNVQVPEERRHIHRVKKTMRITDLLT